MTVLNVARKFWPKKATICREERQRMKEVAIVAYTWLHLIVLVIWIGHMVNALILFAPLAHRYVKVTDHGA